jgi:hypothetical protein
MEYQKVYGFVPEPPRFVVRKPVEPEPPANTEEVNDLAVPSEPEESHHGRPSPEFASPEAAAHHPSEDRHRRKCQICRHPDLDQIEEDFLQWRRPWAISNEYGIPEASLFRHAHARNLFCLRRENLHLALDRVIERGSLVENTGDTIIRAVRAEACLTQDLRWLEPAKRLIITNETLEPPRNVTYQPAAPNQIERGN